MDIVVNEFAICDFLLFFHIDFFLIFFILVFFLISVNFFHFYLIVICEKELYIIAHVRRNWIRQIFHIYG